MKHIKICLHSKKCAFLFEIVTAREKIDMDIKMHDLI
jgi:hypothetical protein